jgi:hypothetical protein
VKRFETEMVGSGSEATFEELESGQWSWKAKAIDSKGAESEWSVSKTFIIQVTVSNHPPKILIMLTPPNNVVTSRVCSKSLPSCVERSNQ